MNHTTFRRLIAVVVLSAAAWMVTSCVGPANRPPVALFTATPSEGYTPLHVRLDASSSFDPDGDGLTYEWSFEDGASVSGVIAERTFYEGTHTVLLRVFDSRGGVATETATVTSRPVPDGYMVRHFAWEYEGEVQTWEALLSIDLYQMYRGRIRTPFAGNYEYGDFVLDPLDDPTMEDLAQALWNRAGQSDERFVDMTLAFVQGGISYRVDPVGLEWPLYPLETLVDGVGDCEDTSILLVSLLRARGIACKVAFVDTNGDRSPDHVLSLVALTAAQEAGLTCASGQVTVLSMDGRRYGVAETAVDHGLYGLGCDPWGLSSIDVIRLWSF